MGRKLTTDDFIKKAKVIHGNKYNYTYVNYLNTRTEIKISYPIHGIFEQLPHVHLKGSGCSKCKESKGEKTIRDILCETQKIYMGCKNIRSLPFDFYLPEYNICIEYDGKQHYEPIDFFGGEKSFIELQKRDQIKNEYCHKNNIRLLRIRYDENIEEKLLQCFNSISEILR